MITATKMTKIIVIENISFWPYSHRVVTHAKKEMAATINTNIDTSTVGLSLGTCNG